MIIAAYILILIIAFVMLAAGKSLTFEKVMFILFWPVMLFIGFLVLVAWVIGFVVTDKKPAEE